MYIHANLGIYYWSTCTFKTFCHKMVVHTDQWHKCAKYVNTFLNKIWFVENVFFSQSEYWYSLTWGFYTFSSFRSTDTFQDSLVRVLVSIIVCVWVSHRSRPLRTGKFGFTYGKLYIFGKIRLSSFQKYIVFYAYHKSIHLAVSWSCPIFPVR